MKLITIIAALAITSASFSQSTVVVSTNAGNDRQAFYSLEGGTTASPLLADWDLAFEITGITGSIMANTAKGIKVYKAPYAVSQWTAVDTIGLAAAWAPQQNSEINWSSGALNQGLTSNPFDLGWGVYNVVTHNITGDSIFVLKLADASWKKFRVDNYTSATDAFTFTWSDLDGGNQQTGSLVRANYANMNFGYYNLTMNSALAHEPLSASWDLVFTKYLAFVTQPVPSFYPVVGCLQNKGVKALQVDGVPSATAQWGGGTFSDDINVIGFDWKSFNMTSFMWEYAQDRTYFVKDRAGNIWKLVFIAYGGSANGNITFSQELVSATSIDEVANIGSAVVYPNPVRDGSIAMIIDVPTSTGTLSVIDMNGKVAMQQQLTGLNGMSNRSITVSDLKAGLYIVRLQGEGFNTSSRLVVE